MRPTMKRWLSRAIIAGAVGVAASTWPVSGAEAFPIVEKHFGMIGIVPGHTVRLNVVDVRSAGNPNVRHCRVQLELLDGVGTTLAVGDGSVGPGEATFLDFTINNPEASQVARLQLRAVVKLAPDPSERRRCPSNAYVPTLEVFDNTTGQTSMVLLPAVQRVVQGTAITPADSE